uniref:Uncharacterized protein n=1 Tax=Parascaris univalens TaxID=6257 RepID=A0A915ASA1_PARUN
MKDDYINVDALILNIRWSFLAIKSIFPAIICQNLIMRINCHAPSHPFSHLIFLNTVTEKLNEGI